MAVFVDSTSRTWNWYERTPGSPEEAFAQDRSSAQKIIDITDWNNRFMFCREWVGYPVIQTGAAGKPFISRVIPQYDPACADLGLVPFLYAEEVVRVEGIAPKTPWKNTTPLVVTGLPEPVYTRARITFRYTSRLYDILADRFLPLDPNGNPDEATGERYLVREFKPTTEYLSMAQGGFTYVTGVNAGTAAKQGIGKIICAVNCVFTWMQVPAQAVPSKLIQAIAGGPNPGGGLALDNARGRVNKDTFLGMPPGTFLLQSFDVKPQVSAFGDRIYQVQLLGKYFEPVIGKGHNYIYNPPDHNWIEVTTDGTTNQAGVGHNQADGYSIYDWATMAGCLRCAGAS